jgi:hypothetical protein
MKLEALNSVIFGALIEIVVAQVASQRSKALFISFWLSFEEV